MLNMGLLFDINMGYEQHDKIRFYQGIRYSQTESGFIHPWSHENTGEQYGFNKLETIIPLDQYLHLPNNVVDSLITGIAKGKKDRAEADDKLRKEKALADKGKNTINESNLHTDSLTPETEALLKQLNGG